MSKKFIDLPKLAQALKPITVRTEKQLPQLAAFALKVTKAQRQVVRRRPSSQCSDR